MTPVLLGIMWRILATLLFTAVAQFTTDKLDQMAESVQASADSLQEKVVSLSKAIQPLVTKIPTYGSQMLNAGADAEKRPQLRRSTRPTSQRCARTLISSREQLEGACFGCTRHRTRAILNSYLIALL